MIFVLILAFNWLAAQDPDKTFEDKKTGWKTQYSSTWTIVSQEEIDATEGKGKEAIEKTVETEIEPTGHRNLIWLKKDRFNSFMSSTQAFDEAVDGPYEETQAMINQVILDTYKNNNLQFDVKNGEERIDGLAFTTMTVTLYSPDRKQVLLTQVVYDRFVDKRFSLTFTLNYNNPMNRAELLEILKASKIKFRN